MVTQTAVILNSQKNSITCLRKKTEKADWKIKFSSQVARTNRISPRIKKNNGGHKMPNKSSPLYRSAYWPFKSRMRLLHQLRHETTYNRRMLQPPFFQSQVPRCLLLKF